MQKLFVYGTLKRGCTNHHFLEGQTFLSEAVSQPVYRMYNLGGYPGLIEDAANGLSIKGELWEIDAPCLVRVDWLEGIDSGLYRRAEAQLAGPHEGLQDVIVYIFLPDITPYEEMGSEWVSALDGPSE